MERVLSGIRAHPYHHHVYPMQLVDGVDSLPNPQEDTYFQTGDWHGKLGMSGGQCVLCFSINADVGFADVLAMRLETGGSVTVRFTADVHVGYVLNGCCRCDLLEQNIDV